MKENTANQYFETIAAEQLDPQLTRKLPLEFLKDQCALPIVLADGQIAVAMAEPLNIEAYDAIASVLGRSCTRVICPAEEIERAISHCYYDTLNDHADQSESNHEIDTENEFDTSSVKTQAEDLLNIANKAPVIKLVNRIFFEAINNRASDIHIEPYENQARIRFRVDGVLHDVLNIQKKDFVPLVSRLKIMANLNIAERRLPQDGQSRIKTGNQVVDIRVSVIPTASGERIVLRLLDKGCENFGLDTIGFAPRVLEDFRNLIKVPHGIILLTGPTGSGKTTTLYAALNELNNEERNILTVEDPIEYQLHGIGQMQIKPKINLTFANCLRHILRQDPDIIMIGEIRDLETAQIAIQASLTGHLVFSTLHTNDSTSAVTRLNDMGIEPYLIASSVIGVMAQRLLRVICPNCKSLYQPQEQSVSDQDGTFYHGTGCENCLQTGYHGRSGIFELLWINDVIKEMIIKQASAHQIKQAAIENGMITLRQDGIRKAAEGLTTLEEVYRITQDTEELNLKVTESAGN